jgi:hypothetical protein
MPAGSGVERVGDRHSRLTGAMMDILRTTPSWSRVLTMPLSGAAHDALHTPGIVKIAQGVPVVRSQTIPRLVSAGSLSP